MKFISNVLVARKFTIFAKNGILQIDNIFYLFTGFPEFVPKLYREENFPIYWLLKEPDLALIHTYATFNCKAENEEILSVGLVWSTDGENAPIFLGVQDTVEALFGGKGVYYTEEPKKVFLLN